MVDRQGKTRGLHGRIPTRIWFGGGEEHFAFGFAFHEVGMPLELEQHFLRRGIVISHHREMVIASETNVAEHGVSALQGTVIRISEIRAVFAYTASLKTATKLAGEKTHCLSGL